MQEEQVEARPLEYVPEGQVLQDLDPRVFAYWPGGQESQLSEPSSEENVPAGLQAGRGLQ